MTGISCSICGQPEGSQATKTGVYCRDCYEKYYIPRQR
jgi:hypothetical protein